MEIMGAFQTMLNTISFQNAADYRTIMRGVKGDAQAKRLSSQFIARFFTKFPNLANEALDAILDLCEDDDVNIRKQAIKVGLQLKTEIGKYCKNGTTQNRPFNSPSYLSIILQGR